MAKTNNKVLKLSMQLAEWLSRYTKDELVEMADLMLRIDLKDAETDDCLVSDALAMTFRDLTIWHMNGKTAENLLKPLPKPSTPKHLPMAQPPSHKLGRNELCWCGTGKKCKYCHGKNL